MIGGSQITVTAMETDNARIKGPKNAKEERQGQSYDT
jgi:hypothetical protein